MLAWRSVNFGTKTRSSNWPALGPLAIGLTAAYVGLIVFSITSDSLMRHPIGLFVAVGMAIVTSVSATETARRSQHAFAGTRDAAYEVAITIISNGHREMLDRCLQTVRESTNASDHTAEIWVLDNASDDGSADMVAGKYPEVRLIRSDQRRGFAANQNQLFDVTRDRAGAILLLNDDVELRRETVGALMSALQSDTSIATIAPTLTFADGTFQTAGERLPGFAYHLGRHLGLGRLVPARVRRFLGRTQSSDAAFGDGITDTGYVSGACMLIAADALRDVGTLDERFNMYSEDADWCLRAAERGWRICAARSVSVIHHRNQSWNVATAIERERSMYTYLTAHGTGAVTVGFLRFVVACIYLVRLLALRVSLLIGITHRNRRVLDRAALFRGIVGVSLHP
jgi:GT2 family glycosyltransferase